jgi:hypothetical protein
MPSFALLATVIFEAAPEIGGIGGAILILWAIWYVWRTARALIAMGMR